MKQHIVRLPREDRTRLEVILRRGSHPARVILRANILLRAHEGLKDTRIAKELRCGGRTVSRVRARFSEGGLERALHDAPRSGRPPDITGEHEAKIVALACTTPPPGQARWTAHLLVEAAKRRGIVAKIGPTRMWMVLRENDLKPWRKKNVVHSEAQR